MQKILFLYGTLNQDGAWFDTTDYVNKFLDEGWRINKMIPLAAAASNGTVNVDSSGASAANDICFNGTDKVFAAIIQLERQG
jgi:hypothetical protein